MTSNQKEEGQSWDDNWDTDENYLTLGRRTSLANWEEMEWNKRTVVLLQQTPTQECLELFKMPKVHSELTPKIAVLQQQMKEQKFDH
jgi:hypothetical protein